MGKHEPLWKATNYGAGEIEVWFIGSPGGKARLRNKLSRAGFARRDVNTYTAQTVLSTVESVLNYIQQVVNGVAGVTVWYRFIPVDITTLTHQVMNQNGEVKKHDS